MSRAARDAAPATIAPSRIARVIATRGVLRRLFARAAHRVRRGDASPSPLATARGWGTREYCALFVAHPHPMWVYDTESLHFLEVNDAAATRWGYTRTELLRLRVTDITLSGRYPSLFVAVKARIRTPTGRSSGNISGKTGR